MFLGNNRKQSFCVVYCSLFFNKVKAEVEKDSFPEGENITVAAEKGQDVMCKYALCMAT